MLPDLLAVRFWYKESKYCKDKDVMVEVLLEKYCFPRGLANWVLVVFDGKEWNYDVKNVRM